MTITLKGSPISVNKLYRGRRFLTSVGKAIKLDYAYQAKAQYSGPVLEDPIRVDAVIYFENKRSDIDNVIKATLDCLTGLLWKDDMQVVELHVFKKIDKENPRIELAIRPLY